MCISVLCGVCEVLSDDGECAQVGAMHRKGGKLCRVQGFPLACGLSTHQSHTQVNGLLVAMVAVRLVVELDDRQPGGHPVHTVCAIGCGYHSLQV